jgi:hypothetical protein
MAGSGFAKVEPNPDPVPFPVPGATLLSGYGFDHG